MKQIQLLFLVLLLVLTSGALRIFGNESGITERVVAHPNVLFIAVDDLRPELGCYGSAHIQSPNTQLLTTLRAKFNEAFATSLVSTGVPTLPKKITKVACVGDSITFGAGITDRENNSYPSLLQKMLGDEYHVRNFGFNGATLLKKGHKPYWEKPPYVKSLEFQPDIVVINLGANDAVNMNWKHGSEFPANYRDLIESYRKLPSKPQVFLCEILPIFPNHGRYEECIANRQPMTKTIRKLAQSESTKLIDLHSPFVQRNDLFPDGLHPIEDGALVMANQIFTSLIGEQPPKVKIVKPQEFNDKDGTSFEEVTAAEFSELETNVGTLRNVRGKVLIDNKHARSGRQCLQIAGGSASSVVLAVKDGIKTDGQLSFWAERWTSRAPFSFRIEKHSRGKWTEIYNGDKQVRVGRAFLSHVNVLLGDDQITLLRFSVTSPANTGILIDDLKISPATPMKVTSVEVVPLALPALVGSEQSAIVKLKVVTNGVLDPIAITEIQASLSGDSTNRNVKNFQPFYGGSESNFRWNKPFGLKRTPRQGDLHKFVGKQPLTEGDNFIWLACKLKDSADVDTTVAARIDSITFNDGESKQIGGEPTVQRTGVAVRNRGDDGVHTYRIPGLATTNAGSLIGVYDVRRDSGGDLPGNIDVGMSRSTDGGRTWEPMKVIMDMGNDPKWRGDGIGDPAVMVDRKTGTIWVGATWSHGNRSWLGSGPGSEPEETGQWILVKSDDDGVSWSAPINITKQVKKPKWSFLLQGPGKGITMADGAIVFPAQYQDPPNANNKKANRLPHSTFIYSRDNGETWKIGTGAWDDTTEAQVVELADGVLMLNCRNNRASKRAIMTTSDMGKTWQEHSTHVNALIEPGSCMASLINVGRELGWRDIKSDFDNEFLLFSNPDSLRGRNHMTIKSSKDSGATWLAEHQLLLDEQGGAGYSCMSMIDAETVGILYEGSQAHMTFQRVKIKDILNPPKAQKTKNPAQIEKKKISESQPGLLKIFLLTGQSNSLGTTSNPNDQDTSPGTDPLDSRVKFFYANRNTHPDGSGKMLIGQSNAIGSLSVQEGYGKNETFWGPEFGFGRQLVKQGHPGALIIKASRAGGGNSYWNKGSADDHMYHHLLSTAKQAIAELPSGTKYKFSGLLYVQGESDSPSEASKSGARLNELLDNLRVDLPNAQDMVLVIAGIAAEGESRDVVRINQSALATSDEDITYVDNNNLRSHLYDRLHFDKSGKLEVGRRMADAFLEIAAASSTALQQRQKITELSFGRPFGDHMVLQADQPVRIWGTGKPGTVVIVSFSEAKLKFTGKVDKNGFWKVELTPQPVNRSGQTIVLSSSGQAVEIKDVLFGDVWICAGQSNMEWELHKSTGGKQAIANANDNLLRLHNCPGGARGSSGVYGDRQMERLWPNRFSEGTWQVDSKESAANFSAVGYYFATHLRTELDRPIGIINVSVGGTPIESWISKERLTTDPILANMLDGNWLENPFLDEWCKGRARSNLKRGLAGEIKMPRDEFGPNHSFKPAFMHQAGIKPFSPLSIRGGLWYQGESNGDNPERTKIYDACIPLLIDDWRAGFQNDNLPFAFVQLPAMGRANWPVFREYQRRSLAKLNNVGMAITIDTGHRTNVHPKDKKPVGNRLAQWALVEVYGHDGIPMGPIFKSKSVKGKSLEISFDHAGRKLTTNDGKAPNQFEIAGADGVYHPADVIIVESKIQLTSPNVPRPVHARYAWSAFPEPRPNLVNAAGLPASPFTTKETFH